MLATILNLRFKSKYLNSNKVDIAVTELTFLTKSEVSMQSSHSTDNANVSTTCVSQAYHIQQEKESLWDVHDNTSSQTETTKCKDKRHFLKEKIQSYLSEPLLQRNTDIYSYWNSSPYPILRSTVLKYLSAPPTSIPSEAVQCCLVKYTRIIAVIYVAKT